MDLLKFLDYGTSIFAIAAIVFIVLQFLKTQEKKDNRFLEIITNHLNDHQKAVEKNTTVLTQLQDLIKDVLLRKINGNGKRKK